MGCTRDGPASGRRGVDAPASRGGVALQHLVWLVLAPRVAGPAAWALTGVRVGAGVVFVAFSLGKFVHHEAEATAFERYGIPLPDAATYLVGCLELAAGLMLVAGVATRLAALALAGDMVGAIATAGRLEGGPVHLGLAPVLLAAMLTLVWAGAGRLSVDGRIAGRLDRRASGAGVGRNAAGSIRTEVT
jgi:putative oxidoreductase